MPPPEYRYARAPPLPRPSWHRSQLRYWVAWRSRRRECPPSAARRATVPVPARCRPRWRAGPRPCREWRTPPCRRRRWRRPRARICRARQTAWRDRCWAASWLLGRVGHDHDHTGHRIGFVANLARLAGRDEAAVELAQHGDFAAAERHRDFAVDDHIDLSQ